MQLRAKLFLLASRTYLYPQLYLGVGVAILQLYLATRQPDYQKYRMKFLHKAKANQRNIKVYRSKIQNEGPTRIVYLTPAKFFWLVGPSSNPNFNWEFGWLYFSLIQPPDKLTTILSIKLTIKSHKKSLHKAQINQRNIEFYGSKMKPYQNSVSNYSYG